MNDELTNLYRYDERKFRESLSNDGINDANQDQLMTNMVIRVHILEKSLSNDSFEPGHGFDNVYYLADMLRIYDQKKYDKNTFGYTLSLSVLREFYNAHKDTKFADQVTEMLSYSLSEILGTQSDIGGVMTLSIDDKASNASKNFAELSANRYSVRTFLDKRVDSSDLSEAITIAMKTPTACNRQPVRVRTIHKKDIIEQVLVVQGGLAGYPVPPCLLLITTDDSSYFGPNERNQGYIDGGLFAMSLLYALEYKELATCALNCMLNEFNEKTLRGMLAIPENEKIIMFIACGYFDKVSSVCKSVRYSASQIQSEISELHDFVVTEEVRVVQESVNQSLPQADISELELLRRPGIKLATLKLGGAIKRRARRSLPLSGSRAGIKYVRDSLKSNLKAKKVHGAIVTICVYNNFGNILQRFALQKFLEQNNYLFDSLDMFNGNSESAGYVNPSFVEFANKYIKSVTFDASVMNTYKRYVVGSDQIWRPKYLSDQTGGLNSFFLEFLGDKKAKRVAYAASFGFNNLNAGGITDDITRAIRPLLNKFNAVSVREESAIGLVDEIAGQKVTTKLVLDPTLLLDRSIYDNMVDLAGQPERQSTDVFYFVFGETPEYNTALASIKEKYGEYLTTWPDTVEEWLRCIRDSRFVVAGSFHAVVFSIIFHTDFVLFENSDNPNERVRHLLKSLGISSDRIVANEKEDRVFDIDNLAPINWDVVDRSIARLRADSGDWLLRNI